MLVVRISGSFEHGVLLFMVSSHSGVKSVSLQWMLLPIEVPR